MVTLHQNITVFQERRRLQRTVELFLGPHPSAALRPPQRVGLPRLVIGRLHLEADRGGAADRGGGGGRRRVLLVLFLVVVEREGGGHTLARLDVPHRRRRRDRRLILCAVVDIDEDGRAAARILFDGLRRI